MSSMKSIEIPLDLKILSLTFRLFSNRHISSIGSVICIVVAYFLDKSSNSNHFFSSAGVITGALGLILSIKHGYLANIKDSVALVRANGGGESDCSPTDEEFSNREEVMIPLFNKARDEGTGILLVIIGAVVSATSFLI